MCMYCEEQKELYRENLVGNSFLKIGRNSLRYDTYCGRCDFEIEIFWCPMCGKRLGDD